MGCCSFCHNIISYILLDRSYFYDCKYYHVKNVCYECDLLYNRFFQLIIRDDKKIKDDELDSQLQPF